MCKTVKNTLTAFLLAALLTVAFFAGGGLAYQVARAEGTTQSKTLTDIVSDNYTQKGGATTGELFEYQIMYGNVAEGDLNAFTEEESKASNNIERGTFSEAGGIQVNTGWRMSSVQTQTIVRVKALQNMRLTITHPEMHQNNSAFHLQQTWFGVYFSDGTTTRQYQSVYVGGQTVVAADQAGAVLDVPAGYTVYWTYEIRATGQRAIATGYTELTFAADTATYDADAALGERDGYPSAFHTYQTGTSTDAVNTLVRRTAEADGGAVVGRDLTAQLLYGRVGGTLTAFKPNDAKTELQTQDGTLYATNWKIFAAAGQSFVYKFTADRYDARIGVGHASYTNSGWVAAGGYIRTYIQRGDKLLQLTEVDLTGRDSDTFTQNELFGGLTAISLQKGDVFYLEFGLPDTISSTYNITPKFEFATGKDANAYQTAAVDGTELDTYYGTFDLTEYSERGKERLSAALTNAKAKYIIDCADVTDDAGRDTALAAAKALLDAIPTAGEELVVDTLAEIETLHSALLEADYTTDDWTTLENAYQTARTAAAAVTTDEQAATVVADYRQAIAGVKTILDTYKDGKIAALTDYYDADDYSAANQTRLTGYVASYTAAIRAAATAEAVDAQVTAYQAAVDAVKTLVEELAEARTEYKGRLDAYRTNLNESAYSADALVQIDSLIAEARTDIDAAATAEAVLQTYNDAIARLNAVLTVVGEYREAAKAEIAAYIDALTGSYAPSAQTYLDDLYEQYAAAIDAIEVADASVEADVAAARADIDAQVAAAKAAVDGVPTEADQLAAYKADSIAAIRTYLAEKGEGKTDSQKADAQAVVTAAETAIHNATDSEKVAELTSQAKFDIDRAFEPVTVQTKKGCGGAVGAASLALSLLALSGAAAFCVRRKRA